MVVTRWYSVVWGRLRTIYCIESARHGRQSQSKKRLYNQSGWIFSRIRTFRSPYSVQHTQSTYHCVLHLPLLINTARTALETSRGKINWKPLGKETLPEPPFRLPRRLLNWGRNKILMASYSPLGISSKGQERGLIKTQ